MTHLSGKMGPALRQCLGKGQQAAAAVVEAAV